MIRIVAKLNPLERSVVVCEVETGLSLAQIVGQKSERIYASVDGVPVPVEAWEVTFPCDGEIVVLVVAPQFFFAPLILLAMQAVFGALSGAALIAAGIIADVVSVAITVGIGMGINSLIKPQVPSAPGATSSRYFTLTQGSNQQSLWGAIPKLYGTYRITPPIGGNYYTEIAGNDQYLHILLCLGHGPLKIDKFIVGNSAGQKLLVKQALDNPMTILVGNTPIGELEGVNWQIGTIPAIMNPKKFGGDNVKPIYSQDIEETNTSYALNLTAETFYYQGPLEYIWIDEAAGNDWIHTSGEAPLGASVDLTFQSLTTMSGIPPTETPGGVKFEVHYRRTGTTAWRPANLDGSGSHVWQISGLYKSPHRFTKYFNIATAKKEVGTGTVDYLGDVPPQTTYDIKVRRTQTALPKNPSAGYTDATWSAVRFYKNSMAWRQETHQYTSEVILMAARIKATGQLSGNLDPVSILATSVLPTYNGSQITAPQPTDNPAWVFADILRGNHLQPSLRVSDDEIDWPKLKEWANYCSLGSDNRTFKYNWYHQDAETMLERLRAVTSTGRASWNISDGRMSVVLDNNFVPVQMISPRNSKNFEFTKNYSKIPHALRVQWVNPITWIQDEVFVMNDGYYRIENGIKLDPFGRKLEVFDQYQLLGWTNAEWQAYRARHTQEPSLVEVLETQGVTDKAQAFREGRYHLASLKLRPETYKVEMDIENLVAQRGDCVYLAHDALLRGRASGRIKQITNNSVLLLDEEVDLTPESDERGSITFCLRVRCVRSDGVIETKVLPIQGGVGPTNEVTVESATGCTPGDLFVFGPMAKETIAAKVIQVEYNPDLSATLTLVPAAPGILEADVGEIEDDGSTLPEVPRELRKPPTPNFEQFYSKDLELTPDGVRSKVTMIWSIPAGGNFSRADDVYIHYSIDGGEAYETVIRSANTYSVTLGGIPASTTVRAYLQSYNQGNGKFSDPSETKTLVTPSEEDLRPQTPTNLELVPSNYVTSDGVVHYEVAVSWLLPGTSGGTELQYQDLNTETPDKWQGTFLPSGVSYTIKDIQPATYRVRIRSKSFITDTYSDWLSAEVTVGERDFAPNPPTNLAAQSVANGVNLTWSNPLDPDLASIQVYESLLNNRSSAEQIADLLANSFFRPISDLAHRYYWVRAVDRRGNLSAWEPTNALAGVEGHALGITGDGLPPPAPISLTAVPDTWQVTLNWTQEREISDLVGTEVWVSTTNNRDAATRVALVGENFYTQLNLDTDTTYYYWIRNKDVEGFYSEWYPSSGLAGVPALVPKDPSDYIQLLDDLVFLVVPNNITVNGVQGSYVNIKDDVVVTGDQSSNPDCVFFPAGVYIRNAMIADGSLEGVKIKAESIMSDRIDTRNLTLRDANGNIILGGGVNLDLTSIDGLGLFATLNKLDAENIDLYISAGAIGNAYIGNIIKSANYMAGVSGWQLNKEGNIEVHNLKARGTVSSFDYVAGESGWKIDENGDAEFNNGFFRGTIAADTLLIGTGLTLQDLVDASGAVAIDLVASGVYFAFDEKGVCKSAQTIYFSANGTVSPLWSAIGYTAGETTGVPITLGTSASGDRTLTAAQMTSGTTVFDRVEISISENGVTDSTSVVRLRDGDSGVVPIITNPAINLPASSTGEVLSFAAASGYFRVFRGAVEVTSSCTFSLVSADGMTISVSDTAGATKGKYTITAMSSEQGHASLNALYQGAGYSMPVTVTKVRSGANGAPGISPLNLGCSAIMFGFDSSGNVQGHTEITFMVTGDNTASAVWSAIPYNDQDQEGTALTLAGSGTQRTLTATQFGSSSRVVVSVSAGNYSDSQTIIRVTDGGSGLSGYLTNESENLPSSSSGVVSSYTGAIGNFIVNFGSEDVTAQCAFSVDSTVAVPAGKATISSTGSYAITEVTADVASVTFKATHTAGSITKVFGLTKAKQGNPGGSGIVIDLTNDTHSVPTDSDGTNGDFSSAFTEARIFEGTTDTSSLWTWEEPTAANGGLTGGIAGVWTPSTRRFQVSSMTNDTGTVVFRATRPGYAAQSAVFTLSKAKGGEAYYLVIESSNGTIFHPGQGKTTLLKARLFSNGEEITAQTPESWFSWSRVSVVPQSAPNDDATWNAAHSTGYKQIQVSVDDIYAKATFFCNIISP